MSLPCHPYSTFTKMETLTCIVFADQFNWKKVRTNPDGTMVLYPYPDDSRATLNYSGKGKNQYLESRYCLKKCVCEVLKKWANTFVSALKFVL